MNSVLKFARLGLAVLLIAMSALWSIAQDSEGEDATYQLMVDSIEASFVYQTGTIDLENGLATLVVPDGYRFLGSIQSAYVLEELWGNPPDPVIGLLFPRDVTPLGDRFTYVVSIQFSEEGYIDDEDAKDLDYDELLEGMIQDFEDVNNDRIAQGYGSMVLVGWASPPFYDAENKKLHWAKELVFDESETHTLNYNIRILGRRGYIELNVIGDLDRLSMVQRNVPDFLNSVEFNEGHTYAEFDPDIDEIAAYGICGLIAGKVLMKVGLLAGLLKFWKIILVGLVAFGAVIKKFFFGAKRDDDDEDRSKKKTLYRPDKDEESEPLAAAAEDVEQAVEVESEDQIETEKEELEVEEYVSLAEEENGAEEVVLPEDEPEVEVELEQESEIEPEPEPKPEEPDPEADREVTDADFGEDTKDKE